MKDKRQKMTLTWPCGDPVLAAYVLQQAAAATGMQLGPAGPSPTGYPGGLFAAAAAAAAAAAVTSSPFGPMMAPRPPGLPPPPAFVSPISSSSNMPHRPTPNLLTPHIHAPHAAQHTHFMPSGGGLSPHSPPIEGRGHTGSAFSPATPPASCDSSSNVNVGQVSPQTTTKSDCSQGIKKETNITLLREKRNNVEGQKVTEKYLKEDNEQHSLEEKDKSFDNMKSFGQRKRRRGSSSGSSSSSPTPNSPSEKCLIVPPSSKDSLRKISSSSPSQLARKGKSPTSLEMLDGLYMVKPQEHNRNNIGRQDVDGNRKSVDTRSDDAMSSQTKNTQKRRKETYEGCNSNGKHDDINIKYDKEATSPRNKLEFRSISPSSTGTHPGSSSASSLFQPYLDIEKK